MPTWSEFEEACLQYLKRTYEGSHFPRFLKTGAENAQYADIIAITSNGSFFIETKKPIAQSGQFVLLPNEVARGFEYSPQNKSPHFQETEMIVSEMGRNYDRFANAGTAGKIIDVPPSVSFAWVKNFYATKGVKYFISLYERTGEYVIAPLERLDNYFSIVATYRTKRSGSRRLAAKHRLMLPDLLTSNGIVATVQSADNITEVASSSDLNELRLSHESGITFFFRATDRPGIFKVTLLSNTNNSNVIFAIALISEQNPNDLLQFENDLSI